MWMELIDKLAELEHEQWSQWTKHFLDNLTEENIARWRKLANTPYNELTPEEQDKDLDWAERALDIFHDSETSKIFSDILKIINKKKELT